MQSIMTPSQRVGYLGMPPVLTANSDLRTILMSPPTYTLPPLAETILPHAPRKIKKRSRSVERGRRPGPPSPVQIPVPARPHSHERRHSAPSAPQHDYHTVHFGTPPVTHRHHSMPTVPAMPPAPFAPPRHAHHPMPFGMPMQWHSGAPASMYGPPPIIHVVPSPRANVIVVAPSPHRGHVEPPRAHHRSRHHKSHSHHSPRKHRPRCANHDTPHAGHMHQGPIIFAGCGHAVPAASMSEVGGH